jgi:adenine-specific DNA-methyltransferase
MNYIGSKLKLSSWIKEEILKVAGDNLNDKTFCDIFAGTGILGRTFKKDVKRVIANDLEYYSFVLNRNYIGNHKPIKDKESLIDELNDLREEEGFVYKHYCLGGGSKRQYFSDENGKKIDALRQTLQKWKENKSIDEDTYFFLLASLLESADKVANTASVYGAYLKYLKKSAQKKMVLKGADFIENENTHKVFKKDSNELIKEVKGDILYLDPPYNHRQYGANYHLLNTIAEYKEFKPRGKSGIREYVRSNYCKKSEVKNSFADLIKNAEFRYIFLSYNNEGLMKQEDIRNIMQKYGRYDLVTKEYQRFKADKTNARNRKADKTCEFLHILVKE